MMNKFVNIANTFERGVPVGEVKRALGEVQKAVKKELKEQKGIPRTESVRPLDRDLVKERFQEAIA